MVSVLFTLLVAVAAAGAPAGPAAELPASLPADAAPVVAQEQAPAPQEPVDLNSATSEELQKVPGIGPTLAARIVAFREENGPFEKVDDLLNVQGIGTTSLERIRPHVTVKDPGSDARVATGTDAEPGRR